MQFEKKSIMQLKFRILLPLFLLSLAGCSFIPNELKTAESLIETAPDSALHILRHLSPTLYKSDQTRALYGLLLIRTLDKKHLPLKPDSLLDYSLSYYEKHPDGNYLAYAYLLNGRKFYYESNYEKSITNLLKARDEVKDTTDYLLLGRICTDMARVCFMQKDYNFSKSKFQEGIRYFLKGNHQYQYFYTMIEIGRFYAYNKDLKSALSCFRKINQLATDSVKKGDLLEELAYAFYKNNNLDSALYYYRKVMKYPFDDFSRPITYMEIANAYFDSRKYDSAQYYASNAFKYKPELRTQRECHRILANIGYLNGDKKALLVHMNQYVYLGDSLRKIESQTKGSVLETLHTSKKEATKSKNMAWFMACVAIFILTGTYLITRFVIRKTKKEKKQIQKTNLQQNADRHKEVLVNHREVLLNKIKERKLLLAPERKKADAAGKIAIDRKLYEELLHINDTVYFYDEMNSVLNNLVNKLQKQFPTVTSREIMWCCLSLLQVPNTDMYMLLETNVDSLKKMKQRLVPKFNLALVSELQDFLIRLISE